MSHRHEKFSSVGRDLTDEIRDKRTYKTNRKITSIAIHCSFSPQGRGDDAHTIDDWHKDRWGSGIGYHYVVLEDGTIQKGRWVDYPGAGVKGYNRNTVQICRIGGMGSEGQALEDVTNKQIVALRNLTSLLISDKMYGLLPEDILGHSEYPNVNKSCPLMNMNLLRN